MTEQNYDIVILGGGSAGYAVGLRAVQLGFTVALVEKDKLGGTCLHRGCIPTKALLHSAEVADVVRSAEQYGVSSLFEGVDIAGVTAFREGIISKKFRGLQGLLKAKKVEVFDGIGKLVSNNTVQVGDTKLVGKHIVLATGSYSRTLPGLDIQGRVITSEQALELDYIPSSVTVLGGGVIGVEFASVWRSFGSEVTIVEGLPRLVPNEEESVSKQLERAFKKRGINFKTGVRYQSVSQTDDSVTITLENGETLESDLLLVAVGRGPATEGNGFEEVGIKMDRGFVLVDENQQTNVENIWAVGDITPGLQLAHRGYQQGIFVAEKIAGLNPQRVEDDNIPKVTYCDPEIASVGLTEAKAKEQYGDDRIETYEYNLAGNARTEIIGGSGTVKMVRLTDGQILGVHMIGARVGELIGEAQLIVNWEAYPEDVAQLIHAHPTQNEALGESAMKLAGRPLHTM